ncbi:hypothetical protein [Comamonas jiangduensis]|uniref:hypothetical protein n=1 Tax=Comamonas jiangduensis TaxID=1194168 RepID=UPI003BF8FC0B
MNIKYITSSSGIGVAALIYAYAVLHGTAYLLGFWGQMNFNIFPYLSLSDFVKATVPNIFFLWLSPVFSMIAWFDVKEEKNKNYRNIAFAAIGTLLLIALYRGINIIDLIKNTTQTEFVGKIEVDVISTMALLVVGIIFFAFKNISKKDLIYFGFIIFSLQLLCVVMGGYIDGRNTYNGMPGVKYLDEKNLCSSKESDKWIYAGYFSEKVLFINKYTKILCVRKSENYKLS